MTDSPAWLTEAKHVFTKADSRLTAGVEEATEYLQQRGHDLDAAKQLAEYLNRDHDDEARREQVTATSSGRDSRSGPDSGTDLPASWPHAAKTADQPAQDEEEYTNSAFDLERSQRDDDTSVWDVFERP